MAPFGTTNQPPGTTCGLLWSRGSEHVDECFSLLRPAKRSDVRQSTRWMSGADCVVGRNCEIAFLWALSVNFRRCKMHFPPFPSNSTGPPFISQFPLNPTAFEVKQAESRGQAGHAMPLLVAHVVGLEAASKLGRSWKY